MSDVKIYTVLLGLGFSARDLGLDLIQSHGSFFSCQVDMLVDFSFIFLVYWWGSEANNNACENMVGGMLKHVFICTVESGLYDTG